MHDACSRQAKVKLHESGITVTKPRGHDGGPYVAWHVAPGRSRVKKQCIIIQSRPSKRTTVSTAILLYTVYGCVQHGRVSG